MTDSETSGSVPEAASKKRRGRPPKFDPKFLRELKRIWPEGKTRRFLQDRIYMGDAYAALRATPDFRQRYRWLLGDDGETFRYGILSELGRLADPEMIKEVADVVCERKLRGKDAVLRIRQWRLGTGDKVGTAEGLAAELQRALNDYLLRYPNTPPSEVVTALRSVLSEERRRDV